MTKPELPSEPIIEPDIPIVDAHHHLWFMPAPAIAAMEGHGAISLRMLAPTYRRHARYLFDELVADIEGGHNIRATVFVDAHAMYRTTGPDALRSVGEVEFANGVAAMAESGLFGPAKACAAIVSGADLSVGGAVEEILAAHVKAGGDRLRGVRNSALFDEDSSILGEGGKPHLLLDPQFREGFHRLDAFGLSFDALVFEPQLPDLIDLARTFPETQIVLNHVGLPLGIGRYEGRREERFPLWRDRIQTLATCANVAVKLGGLGMPMPGFKTFGTHANSEDLAEEWKPYILTCIDAFGPQRCLFESNFPVDAATCTYRVLWNAFKRLTAGASSDEKLALFSGTASRIYRFDLTA